MMMPNPGEAVLGTALDSARVGAGIAGWLNDDGIMDDEDAL